MEMRIDELKRYVRFNDEDARRLAGFGSRVMPELPRIAQQFYERIREHEDAHAVLSGEEQIARLQSSMVRWLERLFGGVYDEAYFRRTEEVGRVHVKVGLPQRYMPLGMALLRSSLTAVIDERGGAEARPIADSLSRLLDIELALMLESYREDLIARLDRASKVEREDGLRRATRYEEDHVKAMELAPAIVAGLDAAGSIVVFNREGERATGYAQDEVFGRSFVGLLLPQELRAEKASFFETAGVFELPLLTRAGRLREIRWHVVRVPSHDADDDRGDVTTFLFGADVTEERVERERQHHEKRLATLGSLAAGLAHEIRNPLNGARLHVAFLERTLGAELGKTRGRALVEALEAVRVVGNEIRRLARLVTDFLDFAQPRTLVRAPIIARQLCERAIELVGPSAERSRVSLAVDLPTEDLVFEADVQRLEQALLNLLNNAIEALAPAGGLVTVRVRREPHHVLIDVEDDGPGIPTGNPPIFDAFFSTKANGTGLGLAIVHRIVTDHGGCIDVDSHPGRTRFRLKLPMHPQRPELRGASASDGANGEEPSDEQQGTHSGRGR